VQSAYKLLNKIRK